MKPISPDHSSLEVETRQGRGVGRELLEYFETDGLAAGRAALLTRIELRHDLLSEAEVFGDQFLCPGALCLIRSRLGLRGFREVRKRVCARVLSLVRLSGCVRGFARLSVLTSRGAKRK